MCARRLDIDEVSFAYLLPMLVKKCAIQSYQSGEHEEEVCNHTHTMSFDRMQTVFSTSI